MFRCFRGLSLLVCVVYWCGDAFAQTPPEKFAGQIKAYTDAAAVEKEILAQMLNTAQDITEFTQEDVKLITAYMDQAASTWSGAAAALQKGDEQTANSLAKRAQQMDQKRDIWNQRLSWRRGQAQREYLPATEETFNMLVGDRKPDEIREIEAFLEAKKARSEGYGRLADAALPDADPAELARLQDQVQALDVEVQVADLKRTWADQDRMYRLYVATNPKISSPSLTAAQDHLAQWREQYEQSYRHMREAEHALELVKRQEHAVSDARTEAYRQAKAEYDAQNKTKQ